MAQQRAFKTTFQNPSRETRGGSTTEMWHVMSVQADFLTEDSTGTVVLENIFNVGETTDLPTVGSLNTNPQAGLCVNLRVSQVIAKHSVVVLVFYRSYGLFVGGPQTITETIIDQDRTFAIPIFKSITPASGQPLYYMVPPPEPRPIMERVAELFLGGGQSIADAVSEAMAANIGRYYVIGGRLYRFWGGSARYDGTSRTRVTYRFQTTAEYAAMPSGSVGNVVNIPALPQLCNYSVNTNVSPPTIGVLQPSGVPLTGNTLPGPYP